MCNMHYDKSGQRRQETAFSSSEEFNREDDLLGDTRDSRWAFILWFRMCRRYIRLVRMFGD